MRLPRFFTLTVSLTAALALAVPTLAQAQDQAPPESILEAETPVAPVAPETPETPETPVMPETPETPETPNAPVPPVEGCRDLLPSADGSEMTDATAFAACVIENLTDVRGTTHAAAIVAMVGEGIATGFPDGTFRPGESISRAQMATMLDAALDLDPVDNTELPDDVDPGSVHARAIAAILEAGISQGRVDGSFGPDEPVSRGHLSAFLVNAGLVDAVPDVDSDELPEDVRDTVHENAIASVLGNGIASGFTDGSFRPGEAVSRGQAAKMVTGTLGIALPDVAELS